MPTIAQARATYSEREIAILQDHLDWYRNLPEAVSLKALCIAHRVPGDIEICEGLASKGLLLETRRLRAKEVREEISAKSSEEGREKVLERLGTLEGVCELPPVGWFHDWSLSWLDHVLFPGVEATVTDKGAEEIVRLYKEGLLKKNDF